MAQECSESSVAISSTPPAGGCWWDLHHHQASSLSPWHQPNLSSNSSCEEDVSMSTSFTNASNHSGLTVESSHRLVEPAASSSTDFIGEHASESQLWSHFLLGVGSNGDLQNTQDVGENFLDALSSKSIPSGIFEPAYDYLKKMDSNWEFTNSPSSFNNFEKHINGFNTDHHNHHHQSLIESDQRMTKLSNLVSNWSIAPPDPGLVNNNRDFDQITCNISLSSTLNDYSLQPQTLSLSESPRTGIGRNSGLILSCYGSHDHIKLENEHENHHNHRHVETPATAGYVLRRSAYNSSSVVADNSKYYYGVADNTCTSARTCLDGLAFNGRLSKPLIDIQGHKPCFKSSTLSDFRKKGLQASTQTVRGQGNSSDQGKKKRCEDTTDTVLKKPKHESSTASSVKMQAPKVKLADKITALQQIVSPYGKTDTASVLLEAIQYIKFLQEQVQLLSNPYMKSNSHKDPWGGLDKKEKGDAKVDLRSRGLCLVPISCTPQVYHEHTGSDYWTPTYRGCLYR